MIRFFNKDIKFALKDKLILKKWIKATVASYNCEVGDLNVILCDDPSILEINKQFLGHNYYTDIITFDYTEDEIINGELYISIDTVKENTPLIVENKTYKDTICNEKDSIILQSTIQGVNAMLLSTEVDWRKHTEVITNTITIEKYIKPKKIRITPQLGVGYGLLNKQTDIYLGIGLSYNF